MGMRENGRKCSINRFIAKKTCYENCINYIENYGHFSFYIEWAKLKKFEIHCVNCSNEHCQQVVCEREGKSEFE